MDFTELVHKRYSVRAYKPDEVDDVKLANVLEAARLAPTAANRQALRILVIRTEGREDELKRIYKADWFLQPPLVMAVVGLPEENWTRSDGHNYCDVDCAIVMDHLILAAANEGLGTCWIGAFDVAAAREVLGLPEDAEPVAFTPLGYPDDSPGEKKRKDLDVLVKYEKW
jgi:nitroreductase